MESANDQPKVLCRFCGVEIREWTNKKNEVRWTRAEGVPLVICEHAPDYWHSPYVDDPEHGHTFYIQVTSRGSYRTTGDEVHTDSEDFGPPMTVSIRAWNLPDALRQAAAVFPAIWITGADNE